MKIKVYYGNTLKYWKKGYWDFFLIPSIRINKEPEALVVYFIWIVWHIEMEIKK